MCVPRWGCEASCKVWHDGAGWHLQEVTLEHLAFHRRWAFPPGGKGSGSSPLEPPRSAMKSPSSPSRRLEFFFFKRKMKQEGLTA